MNRLQIDTILDSLRQSLRLEMGLVEKHRDERKDEGVNAVMMAHLNAVVNLHAQIDMYQALQKVTSDDDTRALRYGQLLLQTAKSQGWPDDGEGAIEYLSRVTYAQGKEDARREAKGER